MMMLLNGHVVFNSNKNIKVMSSSKTFSFKKNSKKAFTLIELSIVLIIIGLLIVAITSGSSLIRNAKLRSITNEAKQYQVAVNSFFMKFDEYPGDFDQILGQQSVAGDNDDVIEWRATVNEGSNAWLHLVGSGILPSDVASGMDENAMKSSAAATSFIPNTHYPASAENSAGWIFNSVSNINYVQLVKAFPSQTDAVLSAPLIDTKGGGALTATDAFSIDNKNDDGIRDTGDIREVFVLAAGAEQDCDSSDTVVANNSYDLDSKNEDVCSLAFKVTIN